MDGRRYLEDLIAERFGIGAGQPPAGRAAGLNLLELRGVAHGLVAAGALTADDAERVLGDLRRTLQEIGWLKEVQRSLGASAELTTTARGVGAVRDEWRELAERPPTPRLLAVMPLAGETFRLGSVEYILLALERWSALSRLTFAFPWRRPESAEELRSSRFPHVRWAVVDDRGKSYQPRGGGASGGELIAFGAQTFEPAFHREASTVRITVSDDADEATFTLRLS